MRLTRRDIAGLTVAAQMYAAPYDLLAACLGVSETRLRGILARWRRAGLADTAVLSAGPAWCWVTQAGLRHLGYPWTAAPPPLSRLAHTRAVLACRMWLASNPEYRERGASWRPERAIRAAIPAVPAPRHIPDAEIIWPPSETASGEVWAVEVELTRKSLDRTTRIISTLLAQRYGRIAYLCSGEAAPVVTRAAASFRPEQAARLSVRRVPPRALMTGAPSCG